MHRPTSRFILEKLSGASSIENKFALIYNAEALMALTLRHMAASWMVQRGARFPILARYLGHADSRTTERTYAHHAPDYLLAAAADTLAFSTDDRTPIDALNNR